MSDLISRQDAMTLPVLPKEYRQYQTTNLDDAYDLGWDDCQMHLNSLPSVQQKPKTGKWIPWKAYYGKDHKSWSDELKCSECGFKWGDEEYKYCPMCQAKMEV